MAGLRQAFRHACLLIGLAGAMRLGAAENTYCSLVVRVLDPHGRRVETPVAVIDSSGRVIEKMQEKSDVRFCDLGIAPVTVRAGFPRGCNDIQISDVPLTWGKTYLLRITQDYGPCFQHAPPPPEPICDVLVRVMGERGSWLSTAQIRTSEPRAISRDTDGHGRALFVIRQSATLKAEVSAAGYSAKQVSCRCSIGEKVREEVVRLDPENR